MNTANWIPDLFMKRVLKTATGLCSHPTTRPTCTISTAPPLKRAMPNMKRWRAAANSTVSKRFKPDSVAQNAGMMFETGHPWMTFKDPCNLRSPQQHTGVVHSSNLCTEITLNTSADEIAVCNSRLGEFAAAYRETAHSISTSYERPCAQQCACSTT